MQVPSKFDSPELPQQVSDAPLVWRNAVGQALSHAFYSEVSPEWIDSQIAYAWLKNPRLAAMSGAEAGAALVEFHKAQDRQYDARQLEHGGVSQYNVWRGHYETELGWLVCGEFDFYLNSPEDAEAQFDHWKKNAASDPREVARADYESMYDAQRRESYQQRREASLWQPRTV